MRSPWSWGAVGVWWLALAALGFADLLPGAWAADIRGELIIDRTGRDWESQQVQEPCILPNPKQPGKLVMFYSGVSSANKAIATVGKAWADESDPFTWHQDAANPFFGPGQSGWDAGTIRLDAVLYIPEEDAYYIYYSGTTGKIQDRIGLAICPAGPDGYTAIHAQNMRRVGEGPVLAPEADAPYFETMASQAAVWREWNAQERAWDWTMYYSYRGKNGILPGLRMATSRDGKTWQRHFNPADPRGMGHLFPSVPGAYYEWHQIFKVGDTYVLSMEVGPNKGERWRPALAVSRHAREGWVALDLDTVLQTRWSGLYRDNRLYHVATPAFYQIKGKWYLYVQACPRPSSGNYIDGHWELWAFDCRQQIPTAPGLGPIYVPGTGKNEG